MALVSKIYETTLTAGSESVSFTDSDIPNSLIRVFCSNADIYPVSRTLSGNTLTVTYEKQDSDVYVALEIVKQGLEVIDGLSSEDTDKALSANQGRVLKSLIDNIVIPTVPEKITDLDDVNVTSIQNGQVLAWDSVAEKFVNVNQSGGSGFNYSTTEHIIGTWIDGSDLYERTINAGSLPNNSTKNVETLTGIDEVVYIEGFITDNEGYMRPVPFPADSSNTIRIDVNNYVLRIVTYGDWSGYPNCYITIRYTKTS